ncbi:hypothetical protein [Caballeronia sp. Lep1P3]|uniref:hypothetical protein n=1 Tax=Caballeronia sp. Lep1P3 TaxID=2878150 RepID=UPI001FD352E9|nr:hypothetical protein [Caballeronia sp. Lep1P3]
MHRIERNTLDCAHIAGGATKAGSTGFPSGGAITPSAPTVTQTGTATSVITVNGQQIINQTVTF